MMNGGDENNRIEFLTVCLKIFKSCLQERGIAVCILTDCFLNTQTGRVYSKNSIVIRPQKQRKGSVAAANIQYVFPFSDFFGNPSVIGIIVIPGCFTYVYLSSHPSK